MTDHLHTLCSALSISAFVYALIEALPVLAVLMERV